MSPDTDKFSGLNTLLLNHTMDNFELTLSVSLRFWHLSTHTCTRSLTREVEVMWHFMGMVMVGTIANIVWNGDFRTPVWIPFYACAKASRFWCSSLVKDLSSRYQSTLCQNIFMWHCYQVTMIWLNSLQFPLRESSSFDRSWPQQEHKDSIWYHWLRKSWGEATIFATTYSSPIAM